MNSLFAFFFGRDKKISANWEAETKWKMGLGEKNLDRATKNGSMEMDEGGYFGGKEW